VTWSASAVLTVPCPSLCLNQQLSDVGLSKVLFREHASAPLGRRFFSLFPGLGYAAGYKITQRIYKFGGQPWFNDLITRNYKTSFSNTFGERKGKLMIQACAGRCVLVLLLSSSSL
jgi:hypothetical protein